jgi:hypothetical protein
MQFNLNCSCFMLCETGNLVVKKNGGIEIIVQANQPHPVNSQRTN